MTKTKKKAPGKCYRKGMTLVELFAKFPDDETAEAWFASVRWPDGAPVGDLQPWWHSARGVSTVLGAN